MAQAFATTYQKNYSQHPINKRKSLRPVDKLAEDIPDGDIWIIGKRIEDQAEGGGIADAQKAVDQMNRRRLWSIYQVDYCKSSSTRKPGEVKPPVGNAILLFGEALYGSRTQKIPLPLPTSRRLYGYIRPSRMYIPITTFQTFHGKVGHDVLVRNYKLANQAEQEQIQIK